MHSYLYHGSSAGSAILKTGKLFCCSNPEYAFEVTSSVLSLTRCVRFAEYFARLERAAVTEPVIFVIDRSVLATTHKITLGRSTFFDNCYRGYSREECEEFVIKPIPLDHPSVVEIKEL